MSMVMKYVPERCAYRGQLPDGAEIEVTAQQFLEAPVDVRQRPEYWDVWVAEHTDRLGSSWDFLAFLDDLSSQAQIFVYAWLLSPSSFAEMIGDENPALLQEFVDAGLVRYVDGIPVFDASRK